jgi:hypothetical protein
MRGMSKSAVQVAREALRAGRAALPPYASRYSKHTYTQPQLFGLLILKQFLRSDYRGLVTTLAEWGALRRAVGLTTVPHYSTLCYAERRLLAGAEKEGPSAARAGGLGLMEPAPASLVAAVDATGLEARHVSLCYGVRRGAAQAAKRPRRRRRGWAKLTAVVHTRSHLIVAAVTGAGPTSDAPEFAPALRRATEALAPRALDAVLADAGYDAEHHHRLCRETLGIRAAVIRLNPRIAGRRWPTTPYRREMRPRFPARSTTSAGTPK